MSILTFKYRGFEGQAEYDPEEGMYVGKVLKTKVGRAREEMTFSGPDADHAVRAFMDAVNDYITENLSEVDP